MSKNEQSHKEKPVSELLQEQSKELKTYIDTKHREMEELLAESEKASPEIFSRLAFL